MANRAKPSFPQLNRSHPLVQGLVFDLPLFEGSGLKTNDVVANTPGVISGGTPNWLGSIFGNAMTFNGGGAGNDLVSFTSNGKVNSLTAFSIEAWVNQAGAGGGNIPRIISKGANPYWSLGTDQNNTFYRIIAGWTTTTMVQSFPAPANGAWHHIVFTCVDITAASPSTVGYCDGVNQTITTTAGVGTKQTDDSNLYLGNTTGLTRAFNGQVSGTRIWNRVLSAQEVAQLYADPFQIYKKKTWSLAVAAAGGAVTLKTKTLLGVGI